MIERVIKNIVSARHNRIVFFLLAGLALGVMEGCRTSHQSILDTFFIKVEEHFYGKKIVFEFQQAPKDSLDEYLLIFWEVFVDVYHDSSYNRAFYAFFESNQVDPRSEFGAIVLLSAFWSRLNREAIDLKVIKYEVQELLRKRREADEKKRLILDRELQKIIQDNDKRWDIRDTLELIFSIYLNQDTKEKSVYLPSYPYTLDYSNSYDTLKLMGILLSKRYESSNPQTTAIDSMNLIFKLQIINLSDSDVSILGTKYRIDDTFDLHLMAYGRLVH